MSLLILMNIFLWYRYCNPRANGHHHKISAQIHERNGEKQLDVQSVAEWARGPPEDANY